MREQNKQGNYLNRRRYFLKLIWDQHIFYLIELNSQIIFKDD